VTSSFLYKIHDLSLVVSTRVRTQDPECGIRQQGIYDRIRNVIESMDKKAPGEDGITGEICK
jgi:hypothetical protein